MKIKTVYKVVEINTHGIPCSVINVKYSVSYNSPKVKQKFTDNDSPMPLFAFKKEQYARDFINSFVNSRRECMKILKVKAVPFEQNVYDVPRFIRHFEEFWDAIAKGKTIEKENLMTPPYGTILCTKIILEPSC